MRIVTQGIVVLFLVTISILVSAYLLGIRLNTTDSIPRGIYRITPLLSLKNNYVIFCPDNRSSFTEAMKRGYINHGLCPSGSGYLMKKVVAVKGDIVTSNDRGVFVNGQLQAYSKPLKFDGYKRPMKQWKIESYHLRSNEILTMTDQDMWSFDARYYGTVSLSQIKATIKKVI